jgi:hypothetical protein
MKQIRKISNLIAEELIAAGMNESDELFESKVTEIINQISEAVEDAGEVEEFVSEDFEDVVFIATEDSDIDGHEVLADELVEVDDEDDGTAVITIYTADGETKEEDIEVSRDALISFTDKAEVVEFEDDQIEEGIKKIAKAAFKKIKKFKDKGKTATGQKKQRHFSAAKKKAIKAMLKAAHKAGAIKKALKTRKKRAKQGFYEESAVKEGFDISTNGMKVSVEEGDIIRLAEDGTISVIRDGKVVIEGIVISENFFERCISEGVLEGKDCKECEDVEEKKKVKESDEECEEEESEEDVEESCILTYKSGKGYVLVKEGSEIPMGNRMRARAFLLNEGYNVSAKDLDKASD